MTDSGAEPTLMSGGKSNMQIIYILYLVGVLTGWLTAIVGVIMAYVAKPDVSDWLASHYDFAIRSFWISFLGAIVGCVLFATLILIPIAMLLFLGLTIWWIVRCVQGLNYLSKQQPIPNPKSWMFAA